MIKAIWGAANAILSVFGFQLVWRTYGTCTRWDSDAQQSVEVTAPKSHLVLQRSMDPGGWSKV